jgi:hypothetical protein
MKKQIFAIMRKMTFLILPFFMARSVFAAVVTFPTPTPLVGTLYEFVVAVLSIVIKIGIPVVVILLIWTGYLFVTAQGDPAGLKTAKKALFGSVVGATILLCAVLIATVIRATIGELGG